MPFQPFSIQHFITVAALATAIAAMCVVGRRLQDPARRAYELGLAVAVAILWVGYQVFDIVTKGVDIDHILPLQLCDLAAIVAVLEFGRPSRAIHALAWFWGVALSSQAVFTPDLVGGPATVSFWAFWLYHLFVVGSGVYAVAVRRFRPEGADLRLAVVLGLIYAVVIFVIDAAFGLNYGYLGRATPDQATLIDVLGPWPARALVMVVLASLAMFLLWLPWVPGRTRRTPRTTS